LIHHADSTVSLSIMKLAISVQAENLRKQQDGDEHGDSFCVVALMDGKETNILGRSETIHDNNDADFCHMFIIEEYSLGQSLKFVVSLHDDTSNSDNASKTKNKQNGNMPCLGSAVFDVGTVLAAPGSTMGKEIGPSHPSGPPVVIVTLEKYGGSGTLSLQLKAEDLTDTDTGIFNKSDPFFELQRKRRVLVRKNDPKNDDDGNAHDNTNAFLWDCIFRSRPIQNNLNPEWSDIACVDISALCEKGNLDEIFRIAIYDYDHHTSHDLMGYYCTTINQLLQSVGQKFNLKMGDDDAGGKLVIVSASTEGVPEPQPDRNTSRSTQVVVEEEPTIMIPGNNADNGATAEAEIELCFDDDGDDDGNNAAEGKQSSGDIVILADELDPPSFVDYIRGGAELKVAVAIDFTASNGDPRKEDSLHYFHRKSSTGPMEQNDYETAMDQICSILAEYDSDQKFPVWGFGAKVDGQISHCFSCKDPAGSLRMGVTSDGISEVAEVNGVAGILAAYKHTFKSGIAMSQPTDMTQVIKAAAYHARSDLNKALQEGIQAYNVLLIFTNGQIDDLEATMETINNVQDQPLSIVIVGVGPGDFSTLAEAVANRNDASSGRDYVRFVDMKEHKADATDLVSTSLRGVPEQMAMYLSKHHIDPNPPKPQELTIAPYNAAESREA